MKKNMKAYNFCYLLMNDTIQEEECENGNISSIKFGKGKWSKRRQMTVKFLK